MPAPNSKKSETKKTKGSLFHEVKDFLEGPLANKAAAGLSSSVSISLKIEEEEFSFFRENGKNRICKGTTEEKVDVHFQLSNQAMRRILDRAAVPDTGIAVLGLQIFEGILSQDEQARIRFEINASFLSLWSKGYFSVLKTGGPEVAKYLANKGLSSISSIKKLLHKLRG